MPNEGLIGADKYLRKLDALKGVSTKAVPQIIAKTTQLARAEIVKIITNEIDPHPATRQGKRGIFTDLVDTGFYRAGWQADTSTPYIGRLYTNVSYAPILEYGFAGTVPVRAHTRKINRKGKRKGAKGKGGGKRAQMARIARTGGGRGFGFLTALGRGSARFIKEPTAEGVSGGKRRGKGAKATPKAQANVRAHSRRVKRRGYYPLRRTRIRIRGILVRQVQKVLEAARNG